ncbi:hypothetical protein [Streptantibioticus cattleyicolor]|uniref:Uncharacterized protein n=1 Tax=Streptantibioticus cattleyicolor (strain ATCC 35852 / DSM 46488 / JCM 4925 / NBRC 14057 / NRRL 8057) TaxID=1003195 RepID=F8JJ73_STREN|nr:hypothetical protein [Streptantibioticus cattleyicolor]AEW98820.1 hypothetical protein SCATT_p06270 [Streptantibioticus cattleyicolor NRRL 8057 = DSM 46488]CCB72132.1 protein of unknown function [Streptantibioticus cattleyicolor NRRL 8057 = DSM 46488]
MRQDAAHPDGDPAAPLRSLLRRAEESIEVPDGLWERIAAPAARPAPAPGARRTARRWPRLPVVVAACVAALVVTGAALLTTIVLRPSARHALPAEGHHAVALTVYNAEPACRPLRTLECSLAVLPDPYAPWGGRRTVGRVWHGDRVTADCVVADATLVTDEAGVTSQRWYHVTLSDGTVGWLPGVRTRNTTEVPQCPAASGSPG